MKKTTCPACGKKAEKRSRWKMKDGTYNRLYVHKTKIGIFGFPEVIESCVVNEGITDERQAEDAEEERSRAMESGYAREGF